MVHFLWHNVYTSLLLCCAYTGSSVALAAGDDIDKSQLFEVNIEAVSDEINGNSHDDKQWPCMSSECDKGLKQKQQLSNDGKLHTCTQCEKRCPSKSALCLHMNIHSGKYKCAECGTLCHSRSQLIIHRRGHSGEKPFECTVCSKRFTTSGNLTIHSRSHSGEKPYSCQVCNKAFSSSGGLNIHMRSHTEDKPYKCLPCNKSFCDSGHLQRHKSYVHSNRRPYDCFYCGAQFKVDRDLKRHVRIHTGAKTDMWIVNTVTDHSPNQLNGHLLKSHNEGSGQICFICQNKFNKRSQFEEAFTYTWSWHLRL